MFKSLLGIGPFQGGDGKARQHRLVKGLAMSRGPVC